MDSAIGPLLLEATGSKLGDGGTGVIVPRACFSESHVTGYVPEYLRVEYPR